MCRVFPTTAEPRIQTYLLRFLRDKKWNVQDAYVTPERASWNNSTGSFDISNKHHKVTNESFIHFSCGQERYEKKEKKEREIGKERGREEMCLCDGYQIFLRIIS